MSALGENCTFCQGYMHKTLYVFFYFFRSKYIGSILNHLQKKII